MRHMDICLSNTFFLMAVQASKQGFFKCDSFFIHSGVKGIEMAKLAIRLGVFQLGRIARFNGMCAFIVNLDDFFMGKVFIGKRRLDMADIGAVDLFCYRVMWQLGNIRVAVPAGNIIMDGFGVNIFIDIIIYSFPAFINSAE